MRILHIDTGREMRGGQHQVILLLQTLRGMGDESSLLARRGSPLARAASAAGISVGDSTLTNLWTRSAGAEIVHAHDARAHTLCAVASRVPFVVSRRVGFPPGRSVFSRWKYGRPSRYLAVSQFVASELERAAVPPGKIDIVYDGVQALVPLTSRNSGGPIVALGSADPLKGRELVRKAAERAGFPVIFSNDLLADLPKASMFVYATSSEGLGSAALLAMSLGIPVIASAVGGLPEVLAHGKAGVLVPNDADRYEVDRFAQAMQRVREDSALALTLIEEGKKQVQANFTANLLAERTQNAYRSALAV